MNSIPFWINAARLRTLPLALSCVVISAFMAEYYGGFSWGIFVFSTLTTILLQVLANFANDYGDAINGADNAGRVGPDRMVQSGIISAAQMKRAMIITGALAIVTGIALLYISFGSKLFTTIPLVLFLLGLLSIGAAVKYTAGKNPYGYRALGDLSVFLFFGLLGVLGNLFLYTHSYQISFLLPAISIGALSMAVLNLNNMRDRIEDQKAGKMTIPVHLGQKGAKAYHIILLTLGLITSIMFSLQLDRPVYQFIYLIPFVLLTLHALKVIKTIDPVQFDPELKKVALSTFFFSILFGLGLIL